MNDFTLQIAIKALENKPEVSRLVNILNDIVASDISFEMKKHYIGVIEKVLATGMFNISELKFINKLHIAIANFRVQ